jgi:hypothetical protein
MPALPLQLLEPANGASFAGAAADAVRLRGALAGPPPTPLFFKWYSSLSADPLPFAVGSHFDFTANLKVGTHVLTFSAKDVAGDNAASVAAVRHGGFAGGPPTAQTPGCVIHVLRARIHRPLAAGTLSKANSTLQAEAPALWGKAPTPPGPPFVLNPDYLAVNRVRYVWIFTPAGTPAGPASPRLVLDPALPAANPLRSTFVLDGSAPLVNYTGPLPAALGTGNHTLILRVEGMDNPAVGHEASVSIVVTA